MIQLLDPSTIDKIAAGEVVERPAAVVKELVENAIDAGANAITVEIKEGGISFIRITDNGCGIAREEIPMAFTRHATSKIKNIEDLLTIHSLGFRGEALSSVAAVAQVELITKREEDLIGCRYEIHGGKEVANEEVGCPDGSTFLIRNLFYNTPVRAKFLKTKTTEGGYISEVMLHFTLSHPEIRFRFIWDGKTKIQTSGNGNVKDNIYQQFGSDITKAILPVCVEKDGMKLEGFVGKPEISRGTRTFMYYYINGRYIKSPIVTKAIETAYEGFTMTNRFPFVVLFLTIDSAFLDVNVHPTKMEVRFMNQEEVFELFQKEIHQVLHEATLIPKVAPGREEKKPLSAQIPGPPENPAPEPFVVMATQNPVGFVGTQLLPESQVDRFMICLTLGYPSHEEEILLLQERQGENPLQRVASVVSVDELLAMQQQVKCVHVDEKIYDYMVTLSEQTRNHPMLSLGMSPRGTVALMEISKAIAFMNERTCVFPEDVICAFPFIAKHRIYLTAKAKVENHMKNEVVEEILAKVKIR